MDYTQLSAEQHQQMLQRIGVDSVDRFFDAIPEPYRLNRSLHLPRADSELGLQRRLAGLAAMTRPAGDRACFLGCGAYDHFIPSIVDHVASNSAFVTAYTPYQAEASQGALQAFFEFQTQVARLAGLDVANASMYEGASAVTEAVFLALNQTGKRRILVAGSLHPDYLAVLKTGVSDYPVELVELPLTDGRVSPETVKESLTEDAACLVIQSPNVYGLIEDQAALFDLAHTVKKTLAIAVFNPIAASFLKNPGLCGADVAVAEGQPLGIPMGYGGPYLGLFAARQSLMRRMPGRLIGQTTDSEGRRTFCLTLQTREQHIRGAKATSNICTNQGLLAIRATTYLSAMGPKGLRGVAERCWHQAHYLAEQIAALDGYDLAYSGPFFHEFVINCPVPAAEVVGFCREHDVLPGLALHTQGIGSADQLLVAVTEKRTRGEMDQLVQLLQEVA